MAQTPLLVAIDFGALVERELRADGKGRSLRKARTRKPESGSSERASGPAPADLLRELESLDDARQAGVRIYRKTMMCGATLSGIDSDD